MHQVPKVRFFVNKYVNLFYHLSVLFSEYFSDEESSGFLNNKAYRQTHEHLKSEKLHRLFQILQQYSFYTWDYVGKSLFKTATTISAKKTLEDVSQRLTDTWLGIYSEALKSYGDIWAQTEPRLTEYKLSFETVWKSINEPVLTKMSNLAKIPWKQKFINAHLVDCLYGASAWFSDVVLPPFPNMDVEKKLLAHELVHTLVPDYFLKSRLESLGLNCAISHTIVDLIAYFGIKEYVTDPEKRGIKPNPNYYEQVDMLYPIFEDCSKHPEKHRSFEDILRQINVQTCC